VPPFRGNQAQREYHELRGRIATLENEINILVGIGERTPQPGADSLDRSLTSLRATVAIQGLMTKREELQALNDRANTLLARDPNVAKPLPPPKPPGTAPNPQRLAIMGGVVGLLALIVIIGAVKMLVGSSVPTATHLIAPTLGMLVTEPGGLFYAGPPIDVNYGGGSVTMSGDPVPTGSYTVDDRLVMLVTRPDKTTATWEHTFNDDCISNHALPPQDVTSLFQQGINVITVFLYDACGGAAGTVGPVFLSIR